MILRLFAVAALALCMCMGAGCGDIFHRTDDILTACQIDAQTPGCEFALDGGARDARSSEQ